MAFTDEFVLKSLFPFFATYLHELGFDVDRAVTNHDYFIEVAASPGYLAQLPAALVIFDEASHVTRDSMSQFVHKMSQARSTVTRFIHAGKPQGQQVEGHQDGLETLDSRH